MRVISIRKKQTDSSLGSLAKVAVVSAFVGGSAVIIGVPNADAITAALPGSGCDIKGNVSINSGERIYHVPGQTYYDDTIINSQYGERWFCSEAEARKAGWRRSRV